MTSKLLPSIAFLVLVTALPCKAEIYTFADFTRAAGGAAITTTHDFVPNEGWSGTPPNTTAGENSLYLKATVSWTATTGNIGTFNIRFNQNDDAGAARLGMGKSTNTAGSGFDFITSNTIIDPDGAGPATARPTIVPFNANTINSVTLVMKIDHTKAGTSPGGDWWFGTEGLQSSAVGFMWINPNLTAPEASQFTPWAAWRSGNASYSGVSFITDTDAVNLTFSNIAIYTGNDTPFATSTGIVSATNSTVSASPVAVPADGTSTSTITVTLKDTGNSPVAGKEVSLAGNGSATITTSNNTSNASGVVTFSVKSSTVGTETFTATDVTDSNLVITQTANVNFQTPVVVGPVSASNSTVVASTSSVVANGITTSTITVNLRDSNGLLITGEGVTLSGNPSGATISPAGAQTTNGSGQAAFTVKSTTIGPVVFTATSVTNNVTITQTANVNFTDPLLAQAFNVNFLDDGQANATSLVGVVGASGETWNQGTGYSTGAISNLVDTTGTVISSVSVSGTGDDGRQISGTSLSLFNANRGFFGKGQDTTISITGLTPNTPYDLYLYALSHATTSWGNLSDSERAAGDFTTANTVLGNGQSQWLENAVPGTNGNAFLPNGNYVTFQSIVSNGSGNISVVVDAYDGIDGNPSTDNGDCRLHVCGLQIRPASGMSVDYAAWRSTYYPTLGLPGADDDGDGFSNDYERIFGLNPKSAASASPYPAPFDPKTGILSYSRRAMSKANLNYKVWYSTNLQQWFEDNAADQAVTSTAGDVEMMGVHIDPNLLAEPKLFLQVRATTVKGVDLPPSLVNLWGSGNTITLLFSEPMNPSAAGNPYNYSVVQDGVGAINVTGATVSTDGGSVTLTLASTLGIATGYTVNLTGVTSGTGQSLGSGVSRQFRTWDNNPAGIKVFILAGQSNMVGYGSVETGNGNVAGAIGSLRYMAATVGSNSDYNYASLLDAADPNPPATRAFRTRADVKVWWRDPGNNGTLGGAIRKGDLGFPYQGGPTDGSRIGPEFAFGHVIGDFYAADNVPDDILIIKTAWGGRDLVRDFRPPSAVARVPGTQVGTFYNAIIEQSREVLNNLGSQFPAWSGRGYQIVGFAWHQGYNDRISTAASTEYKNNLPDLINDLRTVFNKPNLPFVIASTGMATGAPGPFGTYTAVEQAQLWVAAGQPAKPANVLNTDTRPFWRAATASPLDQGHHWNHNAESYFLIGKSLGDNMLDLLTP